MEKRNHQSEFRAQGMVEFALVLPILLMVILGIFAFGHLFFVYSSTVAASREAARFGAAAGISMGGLPRYQNCNAIRGIAVQRGLFAGVTNDASVVSIEYDNGPGSAIYDDCPVDGIGPDVELGDRIVVTINVMYQSAIPLVNIPSFPLTAVTRRTIVRGLPVGDAPTAEPICPFTEVSMEINGESSLSHTTPSVVGQPVSVFAQVTADDGTEPTNADSIDVIDNLTNACLLNAPSGTCAPWTYWNAGEYLISAYYDGDFCYEASHLENQPHQVIPANTITTILSDAPDFSTVNHPIEVRVNVQAEAPGARLSWANEKVAVSDGVSSCEAVLDAAGNGSCILSLTRVGMSILTASYGGDANYNPSSDDEQHLVVEPTPTLVPTPTGTPKPAGCPTVSGGIIFTTADDIFHFDIRNPGTSATNITSVEITWPDGSPIARLSEVRFDTNRLGNACSAASGPDCIWSSTSGLNPPNQTINNSLANWNTLGLNANQTKQMRVVFSHNLQNGPYRVVVNFSNSCSLQLEANRLVIP